MQYSVYNAGTRKYDYYEDGRAETTHAGAPTVLATGKARGLGLAPEAATWKLPWGARRTGSGDLPKGRIASTSSALGELVEFGPVPLGTVLAAGAVYLAWRILK